MTGKEDGVTKIITDELGGEIELVMARPVLSFPARDLRYYMESLLSTLTPPALYAACEWTSGDMCSSLMKKGDTDARLRVISSLFSTKGWCDLEFLELDKNTGDCKVRVKKCFECVTPQSTIRECYMMRGLLAGALGAIFKHKMVLMEVECIFKGNEHCEFVAHPLHTEI